MGIFSSSEAETLRNFHVLPGTQCTQPLIKIVLTKSADQSMWWFYTFHTLTNSFWTFQERIASQNDPSNTRIRDVKMWCELHKHLGDSIVSNLPLRNRFTVCMVPSMRDPTFEAHDAEMREFRRWPFYILFCCNCNWQKPFPRSSLQSSDCKAKKLSNVRNSQEVPTAAPLQCPSKVTSKPSSAKARFGRKNEVAMKFDMSDATLM